MQVIAEQLPVFCELNLGCWARLCSVCTMVRNVDIAMVKGIRVDRIHSEFAFRGETSWRYEVPLGEADQNELIFEDGFERHLLISVVHVPKVFPEGAASKRFALPVQCTVDGNTCWYRLVASRLGTRRCESFSRAPNPYAFLLETMCVYGDVFSRFPDDFPYVFCLLSPCGEAIDFDFMQFESLIAADMYPICGGAVFQRLGQAIEDPVGIAFPLRMHESYPAYAVGENVGLTTGDMARIEKETDYVFEQRTHGISIHWASPL